MSRATKKPKGPSGASKSQGRPVAEVFGPEGVSEKNLSDNIVSAARALGWLVHRDPTWRATGADPGYPDLTLCRDGRLVFAELKREKGWRVTPEQAEWMKRLKSVGVSVEVYLWRPSDWLDGEVDKVLK